MSPETQWALADKDMMYRAFFPVVHHYGILHPSYAFACCYDVPVPTLVFRSDWFSFALLDNHGVSVPTLVLIPHTFLRLWCAGAHQIIYPLTLVDDSGLPIS